LRPRGRDRHLVGIGASAEPPDLVSECRDVERLELGGDRGDASAGGFLSDAHLGELRAEPPDFGFELVHRTPTRAAAGENR
jgi:hypothetical protein